MKIISCNLTFFVFIFMLGYSVGGSAKTFTVDVENVHIKDYLKLNPENPGILERIGRSKHGFRRILTEIYIMETALGEADADVEIIFNPVQIRYKTLVNNISTGKFLTYADTVLVEQLQEDLSPFLISQPVLQAGQHQVGLYTSENNTRALNISIDDVSLLTSVSNPMWEVDWSELEAMNLKRLDVGISKPAMIKSVANQRVDFFLLVFQNNQDMSLQGDGRRLIPIPGLKFRFRQSRHFVVAKNHPQGQEFFSLLERGLTKMKSRGEISKAFEATAVINKSTKSWKIVNP